MPKKTLLFAPAAYDLAETTRMIEIAKAVARHPDAGRTFAVHFISNGGDFERLIEKAGFPLRRMEPRLTPEKIDFIFKVDKGEKFAPVFSQAEALAMIDGEVRFLRELEPAAVVTGYYLTIPVSCRIGEIPLVWVIQSTWLEEFFAHGAGTTDGIRFRPLKAVADRFLMLLLGMFIRYAMLNPINRAAAYYGVPGYKTVFEYWGRDLTLVAEPEEFTGAKLPENHYYIGPLIARQDFPLPDAVRNIPHDRPVIYFAMGSSGTPEIVARIAESFSGKPYRVIAPIQSHLDKVPGVRIPPNVLVTGWLPALEANRLADLSLIHGGIGTVMTAAYAGKPVVGVGMQPEQTANLAALVRKGFAIQVAKSSDPSKKVQRAIHQLLHDETAKRKAKAFAKIMEKWDGPRAAAELLYRTFGA
jgi:UDP:flavonoid glycosyltransferase YjiC (YdhE family)